MRTLLRYYYLDGVGVEELGRLYRVHASTVSRWLRSTREAILEQTRSQLAAMLVLKESEVESMLGLSGSLGARSWRVRRSTTRAPPRKRARC